MRVRPRVMTFFRCLLLLTVPIPIIRAQELPFSATPRGVVFTFLTETASSIDTIDRAAFGERLAGEFMRSDPGSFHNMLPAGSRFRIDSIPNLATAGELRRVAAWVTVETGGERENWYFFCVRDSIWRLAALRRFPTASQRAQIRESLSEIDTTTAAFQMLRSDLQRMLLPDEALRDLFLANRADAGKLVEPLRRSRLWTRFALREVDFLKLEEYRELDDDIDAGDRIFYTLDRNAIERLKRTIGLRQIIREDIYPGLIFFVVGGIDRSTIGFLHADDPGALPALSENGFITLRPLGGGWWLYRRMK